MIKTTLLSVTFAFASASILAQPALHGPGAPFNPSRVDITRNDPTFGHMRRIYGNRGWNHMGGSLYYGPHWHNDAYWYWNPGTAAWIAADGIITGAAVGVAAAACCLF